MSTAALRVRQVLDQAGLPLDVPLARIESARNEVWFAGEFVVRIASHVATHRLNDEAAVLAMLPPEVPHPGVVATGRASFGEWTIMPRIRAYPLSRQWLRLQDAQRYAAILSLGRALAAIHSVDASHLHPQFLAPGSLECAHQLPFDRLYRVIDRLRSTSGVDRAMVEAAEQMASHAEPLMGPMPTTLIHGDFHLENVLVHDGLVKAVIDFEFARPSWPEVDLEILLRFCAEPELHVSSDYAGALRADAFRPVVTWLRDGYPELFEAPHLEARVNVCSLAYDLRDLAMFPPDRPRKELPPFHPVNRLARLLDGQGLLQLVEW
jgi:hygromycin-B 7''-O-kinase